MDMGAIGENSGKWEGTMGRFLIWGTGRVAERYGMLLEKMGLDKVEIIGFIDHDSRKHGKMFRGKTIFSPDDIPVLDYDYITIWSSVYYDEIYLQIIKEYNVSPSRVTDIFSPYKQKLKEKYLGTNDAELQEILHRIEEDRGINVYYFRPEGKQEQWDEVFYDAKAQLHYIFFEGKRMYLKRDFHGIEERDGKKYVRNMYEEQDINSPHRYEEKNVIVGQGDILIDAGACEGNFSLHHIDKVSKVYMIECDKGWMEALRYTFGPYKDKVVFCEKFLSNTDSENTARLDTLVKEPVDFIKMDIEGEEIRALEGGRGLLSNSGHMKCAICAYHRHGDEEKIKEMLGGMGFETSISKGYMLFLYSDDVLKEPELRRGIIRGRK